MKIVYADEFVKRFSKLPMSIKKKAVKQELIFCTNQLHPSLNTEKLIPKTKQLWSFRVDSKYRVIFTHTNDGIVLFLSMGTHDWVYKYTDRL